MKKIITFGLFFSTLFFFLSPAQALDPLAKGSMKNEGMIHVQTPNPSKDEVQLTSSRTGKMEIIKSGKVEIVPAGIYKLRVLMEGEANNSTVTVRPTERTDVLVGYGNLKVQGPSAATIQVFDKKEGKLMAEFPAGKTQLLPRGRYAVKVRMNGMETTEPDVLIVGSKTSTLKVRG